MDPNPELGAGRHCIFSLENKTWEFPVPVMLEEQKDGFKVDWLAFVEFKDRMLEKFLQAYQEGPPARFHVGIIRHHYFEDNVPSLDRKDAFRISPAPPNTFHAYALSRQRISPCPGVARPAALGDSCLGHRRA
jgi:hypothetical protein